MFQQNDSSLMINQPYLKIQKKLTGTFGKNFRKNKVRLENRVKNTKKIDRDVLLEKYVRKIVRLGNILKNTKKLTGEVGEIKLFWKIN